MSVSKKMIQHDYITRTINASNGFPALQVIRMKDGDGSWWIAATTMVDTVFVYLVRNRAAYKDLVADVLPNGVARALKIERKKTHPSTHGNTVAMTHKNFLMLLNELPLNDTAWKIRVTEQDVQAYTKYVCDEMGYDLVYEGGSEEDEEEDRKRKRRTSPPRKVSWEDEHPPPPMGFVEVVQNAFDERVKEEAIARYMMMPECEAQAQELLAKQQAKLDQQSEEIRIKTMELMLVEMDKAIERYLDERKPDLEAQLRDTVIKELSQRPDIMAQARNVALVNARAIAEQEDNPKRARVSIPLAEPPLRMSQIPTMDAMLAAFKNEMVKK